MQEEFKLPDWETWLDQNGPDVAMLAAISVVALVFFAWFFFFRAKPKQKRKRMDKRRKPNPTRAQVGGLPPPREPDAPPHRPL